MIRFEKADDGQITLAVDPAGAAELDAFDFGEVATGWSVALDRDPDWETFRYALPDSPLERDLILDCLVAVDREAAAALEALL